MPTTEYSGCTDCCDAGCCTAANLPGSYSTLYVTYSSPTCAGFDGLVQELTWDSGSSKWIAISPVIMTLVELWCDTSGDPDVFKLHTVATMCMDSTVSASSVDCATPSISFTGISTSNPPSGCCSNTYTTDLTAVVTA